jgi:hypothetical protein
MGQKVNRDINGLPRKREPSAPLFFIFPSRFFILHAYSPLPFVKTYKATSEKCKGF